VKYKIGDEIRLREWGDIYFVLDVNRETNRYGLGFNMTDSDIVYLSINFVDKNFRRLTKLDRVLK
jgi:hypothetical protein